MNWLSQWRLKIKLYLIFNYLMIQFLMKVLNQPTCLSWPLKWSLPSEMWFLRFNKLHLLLKPQPNDHNMPTQHIATLLGATCCVRLTTVLRHVASVVGSNLKMVKFEPTTPNMSQHITTWLSNTRNMLRPTVLWHVALAGCNRLARALHTVFSIRILIVNWEVISSYLR